MAVTFNRKGDRYPFDSDYAHQMAKFLPPPSLGAPARKRWAQVRDWASSRRLSASEVEDVLRGTDYVGTPTTFAGWDDLARRLNIDTTRRGKKKGSKPRPKETDPSWIQEAEEEIQEEGTEGTFTNQARARGWKDTLAFARAVMAAWDRSKKTGRRPTVKNKRTGKVSPVDVRLMRRANFALNVQPKKKGSKARPKTNPPVRRKAKAKKPTRPNCRTAASRARPKRFVVRPLSVTGGWQAEEYDLTWEDAKKEARAWSRKGYVAAVFEGRKKKWEPGQK